MPLKSESGQQVPWVAEDAVAQAAAEWRHDDILLQRRIAWARSFNGSTAGDGLPMRLRRGERVFFRVERVRSLEAARASGPRGAVALKVRDEGVAVVTDQRVVFAGAGGRRVWEFRNLESVEHDGSRPITLLGVSTRRKASGLSYPVHTTAGFQLSLSLAVAHFRGDRDGFIARLEHEQAVHLATRPAEPTRRERRPVEQSAGLLERVKTLVATAFARAA